MIYTLALLLQTIQGIAICDTRQWVHRGDSLQMSLRLFDPKTHVPIALPPTRWRVSDTTKARIRPDGVLLTKRAGTVIVVGITPDPRTPKSHLVARYPITILPPNAPPPVNPPRLPQEATCGERALISARLRT